MQLREGSLGGAGGLCIQDPLNAQGTGLLQGV